ncbi:MAG: hypothetical protein K2P80_13400 [Beijerinckiaceae bacterium]|nr:hypothetical protein [Beijerinckiaceae bacterium]
MMKQAAAIAIVSIFGGLAVHAEDQGKLGLGNALAVSTAEKSALVQSSRKFILTALDQVADGKLRDLTKDGIDNIGTCIAHRAGLTAARRQELFERLKAENLIDLADEGKIGGGLINGVFPPLLDDGGACPRLPQPYWSAPGSVFGGHHSQPGGLPVHVALNLSSGISLADNYRRVYGVSGEGGVPVVAQSGQPSPSPAQSDIAISQDITILAPIWHDWAKSIVFQWNADGSEFAELNFGGNGKTDNFGVAGDSKTGAHHIIGIAEVMKRGFPADYVVTHASAHSVPTSGFEYRVVNWLRAAAILADVDPVDKGYLTKDKLGRLRLADMRQTPSVAMQDILPNEPHLLVEYVLHNISDSDFTFTGPATAEAQVVLKVLASRFGFDPNDAAVYNTRFRNPVLAHLSAERVQIIYANKGLDGVAAEVDRLKKMGLI